MGLIVAAVAIAGLCWQHHSGVTEHARKQGVARMTTTAPADSGDQGDSGQAIGEYQPDPRELSPPPDFSPDSARTTAQRFATNFAAPNADLDDWLARISPDVSDELAEQYRLTDIRNVPHATVQSLVGPLDQQPGAMAFQIGYSDGMRVEIRVGIDAQGWKVINVVPLNTADTPPSASSTSVPDSTAGEKGAGQ